MGLKTTKKLHSNNNLINDILQALGELNGWGSVEVYVQNNKVTQITKRAIKKTNHNLEKAF